ncbi:MAG: hypothetical protein ACKO6N_25310 [Myxococcota bacterium]
MSALRALARPEWALSLPSILSFLSLSLLHTGCQDDVPQLEKATLRDLYVQAALRQVDILLVVDSSGSMQDEQEKLVANFQTFIASFAGVEVDYHIGVITTDVSNEAVAGILQGDPYFITPETLNAEEVFYTTITEKVGIRGSGLEMGLEAARLALSEPLVSSLNQGFYRPEAALSMVIFSDEDDLSPLSVDEYLNLFAGLKGTAAYRDKSLMNLSAVVGDVPYGCETADGEGGAVAGTRYIDAAIKSEGVYSSICSGDFAPVVQALGLDISGLKQEFFLTRCARAESLEVEVNGEPQVEGMAYVYQPERRSVLFLPSYEPPPSAEVSLRYEYYPQDYQVCPED